MRLASQLQCLRHYVWRHPINRRRRLRALLEYLAWQIGSRLVPGPVAVVTAGRARLLCQPGVDGALPNVWAGLGEFEDMGLALHLLRPGDLFADVGANVGAFTMLAAAQVGARCVAFEPGPVARGWLERNLDLNGCRGLVEVRPVAVGAEAGRLHFTVGLDTQDHVVPGGGAGTREVAVETLDGALGPRTPALMKIDVEGYLPEALAGAAALLERPGLMALIVEVDTPDLRELDGRDVYAVLLDSGFSPMVYDPFTRRLAARDLTRPGSMNVLWVRDSRLEAVRLRLAEAPAVRVKGLDI